MDLSRVPVVRYVWAWWRVREQAVRRTEGPLPPVITQFQVGELIAIKGWHFRVAHLGEQGIVLAPVAFTASRRKKLIAQRRAG